MELHIIFRRFCRKSPHKKCFVECGTTISLERVGIMDERKSHKGKGYGECKAKKSKLDRSKDEKRKKKKTGKKRKQKKSTSVKKSAAK
jgi:hypothetical protein